MDDQNTEQRFTTHKERADWFQQRTTYPKREAYPSDLSRARAAQGPVWTEIGPPDIGGRLTSMAVDPANPDHVFVGAAGGGVWHTTDAGRHWRQVWSDQERTLAIGSLALDPKDPKTLYAGTGEANLSGDNYAGVGLFRSKNSGRTWELAGDVADRFVQGKTSRFLQIGLPRRIGAIAIDPSDSKHILVGGVTHSEAESAALFETFDGGQNWRQASDANGPQVTDTGGEGTKGIFISPLDYYCHFVMFHPDDPKLVFATVEARGIQSGIWRSEDGAKSWVHAELAEHGLPSGDQFGRTSLAMAPGSKTIYALAGQQGTQQLLGVYRSDDLGLTWTRCADGKFANDGQLSYTNCIAMDPDHPKTAILGSLELHRTTDGGATWERISDSAGLHEKYVHSDHHALWIGAGRVYSANDGGFAVSMDGGDTWKTRNNNLSIAMLYDVDVAPSNSGCMSFGIQDNGTWFVGALSRRKPGVTPPTNFRAEQDGDGGWTCYDPDDETHVYASQQRMDLKRHRDADGWSHTDLLRMIPEAERRRVWMAVVAMDRSRSTKPRTAPRAVYIGSNRLWRSLDDGDTWTPISDPFDGSAISAIEVAKADPKFLYIGTGNGGVFRSVDGGASWSRNLAGPLSPGRLVTRIVSHPSDPKRMFYTVGVIAGIWFPEDKGSQPSNRILRLGLDIKTEDGKMGFAEFRHLYETADGGNTWTDPDQGNLPNLPHNSVVVTDLAVCVAHDGGVSVRPGNPALAPQHQFGSGHWVDMTGNLPNIRITDLIYHEQDRLLVVSTYGRGAWKLTLDDLNAWGGLSR